MALAATTLLLLGLYKISTTDIVYGQPTVTTTNEDDTFTAQMTAVSKRVLCLYINHTRQ